MKKNYLLLNFIVLLFSMTFGGYALQPTAADVYTPTVTDDEVSVFLETSSSQVNIWAWNDQFNKLTSAEYPGDALTFMGKALSGKNIFKWTFKDASSKGMPTKIIFNKGIKGDENKIGGENSFKNHGYYVEGVFKKIITNDIYLLTSQTLNGKTPNKYDSDKSKWGADYKMTRVNNSTVYKFDIETCDEPSFSFRLGVYDWETAGVNDNNQMQPQTNDTQLEINEVGSSEKYDNAIEYFGNKSSQEDKAWKVDFDNTVYSKLTVYVDINDAGRKVWVEGTKSSVSQKTFTLLNNGTTVSTNTTGSFVMDLTSATAAAVVSFKIGDAAYGFDANNEISVAGETNYTATEGATGTLTLKAGLIYTISITADGAVKVVAAKKQVYTSTAPVGYYLVGNFMSPANVGGEVNPGGDDKEEINYNRLYFRFTQQSDNKYSFDIPACLTANMQILKVADNGDMTAYGPGAIYDINGTWPQTNLTVPKTGTTASLKPSAKLDKGENYWRLKTRNDGTYDDDGMYTVSFEVDKNGTPTNWSITHNSLKMVAYLLSTSYGASALPIYDTRKNINSLYGQNIKANIHFDGRNSYYVLGYSVYNMSDDAIYSLANKAYKESGSTDDIKKNSKFGNNNYGTQNKLFFFGNGGYEFSTSNNHNKLIVNQKPFTLNISGTKTVEYNPNQGDNDLSKTTNACGMSAELKIPNEGTVDYPNVISLVGSAIPGTTNTDGSWNWASTAANMTFDATENCYYATIETTAKCHEGCFRFVGDHSQAKNWYEDDINTEAHMAKCEHQIPTGHTCLVDDPNTVSYTFNGETEKTGLENGIIWNREPGLYTVKLYIVTNPETKNTEFKYTITGEKNVKYPFTLLHNKFVRAYSSSKAMDVVSPDVKAYIAYNYVKPGDDEITKEYSCGKIYLRKIDYIPANMGVVLVGTTPGEGFSEGDVLNYSLRQRTEASATTPAEFVNIWTFKDKYAGEEWNNYLEPVVEPKALLGNIEKDKTTGKTTYRYFALSSFHKTKYYKENPDTTIPNYLGFFRLTPNSKSSANKSFLRLPASATVGNGEGAKYGYCDYNGQFIGGETDDDSSEFAKVMLLFDDEMGGVTEVNKVEVTTKRNDNAYYTLQGFKVLRPTKGIYIHNGKKIVIK